MSKGAIIDLEGRVVISEEEIAASLGFVNVHAFRAWRETREEDDKEVIDIILVHVCNLVEEVKTLKKRIGSICQSGNT